MTDWMILLFRVQNYVWPYMVWHVQADMKKSLLHPRMVYKGLRIIKDFTVSHLNVEASSIKHISLKQSPIRIFFNFYQFKPLFHATGGGNFQMLINVYISYMFVCLILNL